MQKIRHAANGTGYESDTSALYLDSINLMDGSRVMGKNMGVALRIFERKPSVTLDALGSKAHAFKTNNPNQQLT